MKDAPVFADNFIHDLLDQVAEYCIKKDIINGSISFMSLPSGEMIAELITDEDETN